MSDDAIEVILRAELVGHIPAPVRIPTPVGDIVLIADPRLGLDEIRFGTPRKDGGR